MMSPSGIELTRRGNIATITLCRPEKGNSLDLHMAKGLLGAAVQCEQDSSTRAVILTGAGRHFCFGGDLGEMQKQLHVVTPYLRELTETLHEAMRRFMKMDAPVVAAVNGTAAGAGVGLMLMADLAVCGQSAKLTLAYTNAGLTPDAGASFLLPHTIGAKRAMELLFLNRVITAQEALDWGLLNAVVPDDEVANAALALAQRLSNGPTRAYGKIKKLVGQSVGALQTHLSLESTTIAEHAGTPEGIEGIAAFLEKRKPQFK
jgi:2-(1,2-epoxy-1,2-dihydrophenyl)acetyl-CoA isomerase